jgi:hypothetical protein
VSDETVMVVPYSRAEDRVSAVAQSEQSLLQAIVRAAADPTTDLNKIERLFAIHERMVKTDAETAFNAALARAQAAMPIVARKAQNTQTNSKYARLEAIVEAISPVYTAEGFALSFDTAEAPKAGDIRIVSILSHAAGHSRQYHIDMPPDEAGAKGNVNKTRVHATGSTNSYARRYLICMIFNVATGDDNDGNRDKKVMPDKALADWLAAVEMAESMEQIDAVWGQILKSSQEFGDIAAHEELRGAVLSRRKQIKTKGETK